MNTAVIMDETKQGAQEEEYRADNEETVKDSDRTLFKDDANTDRSDEDEESALMEEVFPSEQKTLYFLISTLFDPGVSLFFTRHYTINYQKQEKQSMDSCRITIHYSKSALYISGSVPFSLFSVPWFF